MSTTLNTDALESAGRRSTASSNVLLGKLEGGASPEEVQIAALQNRDASTIFTTALRSENSRSDALGTPSIIHI